MRPITGATITDEQIRELCPQPGTLLYLDASIALFPGSDPQRRAEARARCADVWNERRMPCRCHAWPRDRCMADGHRPDCTARGARTSRR